MAQDPEDRIAELERQLSEAKAAAWQADFAAQAPYSQSRVYEQPLAEAPRKVPLRFVLAELLPFRWWYLFALFIIAIPPIIVWIMNPALLLPAAVLSLLVIYGVQFRAAKKRLALVKWGQVATVVDSEVLSQGTYYGGTTYSNVILPVAKGWTVTRPMWSGPKTKTKIRYRLGGYEGDLTVGGREYTDGVVLADQRRPERALCVTSFPYDLDRDETGNWVGRLRVRLQIGMVCWLLFMIAWVVGPAVLFTRYEAYLASLPDSTATPPSTTFGARGAAVTVNGAGETRSIVCDQNDVTVLGSANHVNIAGHCRSVSVTGSENQVSVDQADTITADGVSNVVTYHAGSPKITTNGVSNSVGPG